MHNLHWRCYMSNENNCFKDEKFMLWAFGKKEIFITLQDFEIAVNKLYDIYLKIQYGKKVYAILKENNDV